MPIFTDTRFELYPVAMWADYLTIVEGLYDRETRLGRYQTNTVFLEKNAAV